MRYVRRSQRGKGRNHEVGDVVEIVAEEGIVTGQLLHKVKKTRRHRYQYWLVTFDEPDRHDAEIREKDIGRLLQKGGDSSVPLLNSRERETEYVCTVRKDSGDTEAKRKRAISDSGKAPKKKRVEAEDDKLHAAKLSNVEVGTKRISGEMEDSSGTCVNTRASSKRKTAGNCQRSRKGHSSAYSGKSSKNQRHQSSTETVEKVKLLTGTLHLYRGENPRVEFVWRY